MAVFHRLKGDGDITARYQAVIFDLFGTLIDNFSRREYETVFGEMAAVLGVPHAEFLHTWAESFTDRATGVYPTTADAVGTLSKKLNVAVTREQVDQAVSIRLDYTLRSISPRDGATEVLAQLRADGYKTGLISDCTCEIVNVWEETDLAALFDTTVFSCVAGIRKPDPRIYKMATAALGVTPEKCLYIGDGSSRELTGAQDFGMTAVLIRAPHDTEENPYLKRQGWEGTRITSLREVPGLLQQG